jgi:hypothetical protein
VEPPSFGRAVNVSGFLGWSNAFRHFFRKSFFQLPDQRSARVMAVTGISADPRSHKGLRTAVAFPDPLPKVRSQTPFFFEARIGAHDSSQADSNPRFLPCPPGAVIPFAVVRREERSPLPPRPQPPSDRPEGGRGRVARFSSHRGIAASGAAASRRDFRRTVHARGARWRSSFPVWAGIRLDCHGAPHRLG